MGLNVSSVSWAAGLAARHSSPDVTLGTSSRRAVTRSGRELCATVPARTVHAAQLLHDVAILAPVPTCTNDEQAALTPAAETVALIGTDWLGRAGIS